MSSTNSFLLKEIELLKGILTIKYGINSTIHKLGEKEIYSLYIKKESVNNVRGLITEYMHGSMLYKLGIDKRIEVLSTQTFD